MNNSLMTIPSPQGSEPIHTINRTQLRDITLVQGGHESTLRRCLYARLLRAIDGGVTSSLNVLDIGCGRGELMELLRERGHVPTGIDLETECVALSGIHGHALLGGFSDLENLFQPGEFNVVVSSHVLEHVDSPYESLVACRRLDADRYVFAVPNVHRCSRVVRLMLGSARPDHPTHVFGWGRPEFSALLNRSGFEVIRWHADRVTINPWGGRLGAFLTRLLQPLEVSLLPRMTPLLSSSLIAECRPLSTSSHEAI